MNSTATTTPARQRTGRWRIVATCVGEQNSPAPRQRQLAAGVCASRRNVALSSKAAGHSSNSSRNRTAALAYKYRPRRCTHACKFADISLDLLRERADNPEQIDSAKRIDCTPTH